jgi:hypothetical protein
MMALSLGVDATPPGVRREPQETKVWSRKWLESLVNPMIDLYPRWD